MKVKKLVAAAAAEMEHIGLHLWLEMILRPLRPTWLVESMFASCCYFSNSSSEQNLADNSGDFWLNASCLSVVV